MKKIICLLIFFVGLSPTVCLSHGTCTPGGIFTLHGATCDSPNGYTGGCDCPGGGYQEFIAGRTGPYKAIKIKTVICIKCE